MPLAGRRHQCSGCRSALISNDYLFFAGYTVLQYIVLATAWNILGGYCGYVNFGSAGFFALGVYSAIFLFNIGQNVAGSRPNSCGAEHAIFPLPLPVLIIIGGVVAGLVGLGTGYLTLRLRGVFFAIATLALAVVLQTLWSTGPLSAARAAPMSFRRKTFRFRPLHPISVRADDRSGDCRPDHRALIERSRLGFGFATIRDDEMAAEASGVPTLKLKLIATTLSGALMGMAGAPFAFYSATEPDSAFGLSYAVNSIAMPLIGGTTSLDRPAVGASCSARCSSSRPSPSPRRGILIVGVLLILRDRRTNGLVGFVHVCTRKGRMS